MGNEASSDGSELELKVDIFNRGSADMHIQRMGQDANMMYQKCQGGDYSGAVDVLETAFEDVMSIFPGGKLVAKLLSGLLKVIIKVVTKIMQFFDKNYKSDADYLQEEQKRDCDDLTADIKSLQNRVQDLFNRLDKDKSGEQCCFAEQKTVQSIMDQFESMLTTESKREPAQQLRDLQHRTMRLQVMVLEVETDHMKGRMKYLETQQNSAQQSLQAILQGNDPTAIAGAQAKIQAYGLAKVHSGTSDMSTGSKPWGDNAGLLRFFMKASQMECDEEMTNLIRKTEQTFIFLSTYKELEQKSQILCTGMIQGKKHGEPLKMPTSGHMHLFQLQQIRSEMRPLLDYNQQKQLDEQEKQQVKSELSNASSIAGLSLVLDQNPHMRAVLKDEFETATAKMYGLEEIKRKGIGRIGDSQLERVKTALEESLHRCNFEECARALSNATGITDISDLVYKVQRHHDKMKYVMDRFENHANEKWERQFAIDQLQEIITEGKTGPAEGTLREMQQRVEEKMKGVATQEQAESQDDTIEGKEKAIETLELGGGDPDKIAGLKRERITLIEKKDKLLTAKTVDQLQNALSFVQGHVHTDSMGEAVKEATTKLQKILAATERLKDAKTVEACQSALDSVKNEFDWENIYREALSGCTAVLNKCKTVFDALEAARCLYKQSQRLTIDELTQATNECQASMRAGKMLVAYNEVQWKLEERNDVKSMMEYTSNIADLKHGIKRAQGLDGMQGDADNGLRRLKELHVRELSNARYSSQEVLKSAIDLATESGLYPYKVSLSSELTEAKQWLETIEAKAAMQAADTIEECESAMARAANAKDCATMIDITQYKLDAFKRANTELQNAKTIRELRSAIEYTESQMYDPDRLLRLTGPLQQNYLRCKKDLTDREEAVRKLQSADTIEDLDAALTAAQALGQFDDEEGYRDAGDKLKRQTAAHDALTKANTIADLESATSSTSGMTLAGKLGTEYREADERLRVRRRSVGQFEESHRRKNIPDLRHAILESQTGSCPMPGLEKETEQAQDNLKSLHRQSLSDATTAAQMTAALAEVQESNQSNVGALKEEELSSHKARHLEMFKNEALEALRVSNTIETCRAALDQASTIPGIEAQVEQVVQRLAKYEQALTTLKSSITIVALIASITACDDLRSSDQLDIYGGHFGTEYQQKSAQLAERNNVVQQLQSAMTIEDCEAAISAAESLPRFDEEASLPAARINLDRLVKIYNELCAAMTIKDLQNALEAAAGDVKQGLARELTSEENIPRLRGSVLEAFDHPGLEDEIQQAQQKLASLHTTSLAQATTIEQLHVAVREANTSAVRALSVQHTNMYTTEDQEARQRLAVLNSAWLTEASDRTGVDNYSEKSIQDHIARLQTCLASVHTSIEIGFGGFDTEFQLATTVLEKLLVLKALAQVLIDPSIPACQEALARIDRVAGVASDYPEVVGKVRALLLKLEALEALRVSNTIETCRAALDQASTIPDIEAQVEQVVQRLAKYEQALATLQASITIVELQQAIAICNNLISSDQLDIYGGQAGALYQHRCAVVAQRINVVQQLQSALSIENCEAAIAAAESLPRFDEEVDAQSGVAYVLSTQQRLARFAGVFNMLQAAVTMAELNHTRFHCDQLAASEGLDLSNGKVGGLYREIPNKLHTIFCQIEDYILTSTQSGQITGQVVCSYETPATVLGTITGRTIGFLWCCCRVYIIQQANGYVLETPHLVEDAVEGSGNLVFIPDDSGRRATLEELEKAVSGTDAVQIHAALEAWEKTTPMVHNNVVITNLDDVEVVKKARSIPVPQVTQPGLQPSTETPPVPTPPAAVVGVESVETAPDLSQPAAVSDTPSVAVEMNEIPQTSQPVLVSDAPSTMGDMAEAHPFAIEGSQ